MRPFHPVFALCAVIVPVLASPVRSQDAAPPASDAAAPDAAELARRIEVLARELDDLKLGEVAGPPESRHGFGPAASKVYAADAGVSIGGYGEMLYENFAREDESGAAAASRDRIDFVRQIVYVGYKYDARLLFNSELEFEHASTGRDGSVSVEFAYVDALFGPAVNARAGILLVPMGFVNELHEPPVFLGARRPETERVIVPSTWRANGAGLFGEPAAGLTYRAYLVESLYADGFGAGGLRGGRQSGSESLAEDLAFVVRADYERRGALAGGSVFRGATAQGEVTSGGASFDGTTLVWEAHAQLRWRGAQLRALVAGATVGDAAEVNDFLGIAPGSNDSVGSEMLGWYVEAGYDVLAWLAPGSPYRLTPYVRHEELDTQAEVPDGFGANPRNDRSVLTLGAAFHPHAQVVLKTDYQRNTNGTDTGVDQWSAALGYLF